MPPVGHWRYSGILGYGFGNADSGMTISNSILVKTVSGVFDNIPFLWWLRDPLLYICRIIAHLLESLTYAFNPSHQNVWEYNLYVSYLGVILIACGLFMLILKSYRWKVPLFNQFINNSIVHKILVILGFVFIGLGLIFNEFLLTALFSVDGIVAFSSRLKILFFDCICIGIGLLLIASESFRNLLIKAYYTVTRIPFKKITKDFVSDLRNNITKYRFILGGAIIVLFACGSFNQMMVKTLQQFYLFNPVDAIPSRLMIYPFSMILLISSMGFDNIFIVFPEKFRSWIKWFSLSILLLLLMNHSYGWWLTHANAKMLDQNSVNEFKTIIYSNINDPIYISVVNISYLLSILSIILCLIYYIILKRKIISQT
tara:strand:- start:342 stop:1454 length:1113 start_codon:yes stop_codon:yes gene_type:complete